MSRKRIVWTYWFVTALLLTLWLLAGLPEAIYAAVVLTGIQAVHFLILEKRLPAFPVQLRFAYLLLVIAGLWGPLHFLHWIQFAGTWAFVGTGYCPLARMLMLLPWNRDRKLDWPLVRTLLLTPPTDGSIRDRLSSPAVPA